MCSCAACSVLHEMHHVYKLTERTSEKYNKFPCNSEFGLCGTKVNALQRSLADHVLK